MDYLRTALKYFCCYGCTEDVSVQSFSDERTHLLSDPVYNNSPTSRPINSDNLYTEFCQSLPKKHDQSVLCCLVQNTNANMIDVGAMDSHNLERHEYTERIKLYSQRLQQQWNKMHLRKPNAGFLKNLPYPGYSLLKSTLVNDMLQIKQVLCGSRNALSNLKIEHNEAIVEPFRIP